MFSIQMLQYNTDGSQTDIKYLTGTSEKVGQSIMQWLQRESRDHLMKGHGLFVSAYQLKFFSHII